MSKADIAYLHKDCIPLVNRYYRNKQVVKVSEELSKYFTDDLNLFPQSLISVKPKTYE